MKKKKVRKTKAKTKKVYNLHLQYHETRTGGEVINPEERFSDRETEYIDFTPIAFYHFLASGDAFLNKIQPDYRRLEVEFNPAEYQSAYAVIVRYSTGDTFGSTDGAWEVARIVLNRKEAQKIKKDIENETGEYDPKKKMYCPWNGYFESLQSVDTRKLNIICHA